jgi:hypothetical protein
MNCDFQPADEKTEAQKSELNCPEHTANKWMNHEPWVIYSYKAYARIHINLWKEKKDE